MENIMSSKLFTTRQGTILLGVIAAVIAAIALLLYLNHYRNNVNANNAQIRVVVAKSLIQAGTPGDVIARSTGMYAVAEIPKKQIETGAIVDTSSLAGQVALKDINPNAQLTAADFGPASGFAPQLNPKQRGVVVSLGSPQEVGGQIGAGSHVDVWITSSGQAASGVSKPIAKLLYQNMYVMMAGTNGGNVMLRATSRQAGTIIFASQNSQIWLVLRPTIGTNTKAPVISSSSLIGR